MKDYVLSAKNQNDLYRAAKKNISKRTTETVSVELSKPSVMGNKGQISHLARPNI